MGCFISKGYSATETKPVVLGEELSAKLLERCPVLQDIYYYVQGLHSNVDWGSVETVNLQSNHIQLEGCYWLAVYGLKHCTNIRTLELSGVGINHRGMQYIASQGMQFCIRLTHLSLNNNDLGDDGLEVLAVKGLPHLSVLTHLLLDHNNIGVKGIMSLSANLHHCPGLLELHLSQNMLGAEGVKILSVTGLQHCTQLTHLCLGVNNIGDEGVTHLCQSGFKRIPNLTHLHLSGNNITARGLTELSQRLPQHCPNLQELYLFFNNFGPEGASDFVRSHLRTFHNLSQLKGVTLSKYATFLELPPELCDADNTAILSFLRSTNCGHSNSDIKIELTPVFTPHISNPSEYKVVDNLDMKNIPSGSVVDFSQCSKPTIRGGKLFVRGSYSFIGTSTEELGDGLCLHTLLLGCVYVGAQSDDDIIAFDSIVFDVEQGSHNVICLRGTVVFRGCYFQGRSGLKVGSGNAPVSVYLVGCTFAGGGDCSVVIESNAQVTMINTTMNGSKVGVSVKDGGSYTAHHCHLSYYSFGVLTSGENATAHLAHCTLDNHGMCAIFANSGKVTLLKCKVIDGLGCGIGLGGLGQVRAVLKECSVSGPACALKLIGDVDLKSSGLAIIDCNVGIVATSTCSGDVWFTNNRFVDCDIHVANLSNGDRCKLLWNGILNVCQQQRLEQVQQTTRLGTASAAMVARWPLKARRLFTHSDIDISSLQQARCGGCGTVEPSHRAFKNCAQCKQECYCSVQCQRSHWKKHRKVCKISDIWTRELYVLGYVACSQCRKIYRKDDARVIGRNNIECVCRTPQLALLAL